MKVIETSWCEGKRMIHIGRGHNTCPLEAGKDTVEAYEKSAKELRRLADACEEMAKRES